MIWNGHIDVEGYGWRSVAVNLSLRIPGDSRGLWVALLAAAGLLAALLAAGVFAPSGVEADPCDENTPEDEQHQDFHNTPCVESGHDDPHVVLFEVDGGRDRELEFRVYPPASTGFLDVGDKIEIILLDFDLANTNFSTVSNDEMGGTTGHPYGRIVIADSGDFAAVSVQSATVSGQSLILTLPDNLTGIADGPGEHLIITIEQGTGILTPETPRGFDEVEEGYPVTITFVDASGGMAPVESEDRNIIVVNNPISSTVPGATVRMELHTYANMEIGSNEEILLDFSGPSDDASFGMPTTITPSRIKIRSEDTFDPADVLVLGGRVTLTVPDDKIVTAGEFTISISQLASIRNPFAAGTRVIRISTFVPHYEPDEIIAVIRRTTTVSPLEGPRGSQFRLQGRGHAPGTVTVFEGDDETIHPGETLASVKTSRGSFSVDLEARGNPGEAKYKVWTRDSNGAIDSVVFDIRSSISLEPATVSIGATLKVTISDWEDEHQEVAGVRIGGVIAYTATPVEYQNCFEYPQAYYADSNGIVSFDVAVPQGVPTGEQTVAVFGHEALEHYYANGQEDDGPIPDKPACVDLDSGTSRGSATGNNVIARLRDGANALVERTVEIGTQPVTISPSTAVRAQRVTITGSDFDQSHGNDIRAISINGLPVAEDPAQFEVSHNGDISATVTVPMEARTGENEVRVVGTDGRLATGTLMVPEPAIELESPQGQRGTSVTATGSGFAANGVVRVSYGNGGEFVGLGQTDSRGNFELSFPVPLTAAIGRTNKVAAVMEVRAEDGSLTLLTAEADHSPPAGTIETSPDPVSSGEALTVRGENFPPFAQVRPIEIAGRAVALVPSVSTSRDGSFEARIRVPLVELGLQPLRVEVSGVVVTHVVEIGLPPLSGPPARVFAELVGAGVLQRVWYLDRPTQEWFFYDPDPSYSEFSNLTEVKRSEVYYIQLSAPHRFQGEVLVAGWNPVLSK